LNPPIAIANEARALVPVGNRVLQPFEHFGANLNDAEVR
jgi:hypothetical protein